MANATEAASEHVTLTAMPPQSSQASTAVQTRGGWPAVPDHLDHPDHPDHPNHLDYTDDKDGPEHGDHSNHPDQEKEKKKNKNIFSKIKKKEKQKQKQKEQEKEKEKSKSKNKNPSPDLPLPPNRSTFRSVFPSPVPFSLFFFFSREVFSWTCGHLSRPLTAFG